MSDLIPYNNENSDFVKKNAFFNLQNMLDSFFDGSLFADAFPDMQPFRADIRETGNGYVIEAELPGVNKEDISLRLKDELLTILVQRDESIEEERTDYIRKERRYGSYGRSFFLSGVKQDGVTAVFRNGVLTVNAVKGPVTGANIININE